VSARAGIVVTGTEVLSGRVSDRNGPWLAERLRELGLELAQTAIVGDRREDILASLEFLAARGVDLIVTSGGLGPTADDITAEVVAAFTGRTMVLDAALEDRIAEILRSLRSRWAHLDEAALRASNRKQALVPEGATVLEPVGTAPGLVVPPVSGGGPTVVVLPGPPRELRPMWEAAGRTDDFRAAVGDAETICESMLRLYGIPESEIAATLRRAGREVGPELARLEVTTCLRRGEIEIVTRYGPDDESTYRRLEALIRRHHADTLFSEDGSSVDDQVAALLGGPPPQTVAVAESCTGGLVAARLTDRPGSSAYVAGGLVVYSNAAKVELAAVDPALIERHGAVSGEVAAALADGAIDRLSADVGVGVTGVAGPGGGSVDKPVGFVCFCVAGRRGGRIERALHLPGSRADVRDRATTVTMHLLRRLLQGQHDARPGAGAAQPARA
jgi:nicotinamide-nucleotide amidase